MSQTRYAGRHHGDSGAPGVDLRLQIVSFLSRTIPMVISSLAGVAKPAHQVVARAHRLAVDRRDDVASLQPGARRRRAVGHRRHQQAVFHAEVLRELIGQLVDRHAQSPAESAPGTSKSKLKLNGGKRSPRPPSSRKSSRFRSRPRSHPNAAPRPSAGVIRTSFLFRRA